MALFARVVAEAELIQALFVGSQSKGSVCLQSTGRYLGTVYVLFCGFFPGSGSTASKALSLGMTARQRSAGTVSSRSALMSSKTAFWFF